MCVCARTHAGLSVDHAPNNIKFLLFLRQKRHINIWLGKMFENTVKQQPELLSGARNKSKNGNGEICDGQITILCVFLIVEGYDERQTWFPSLPEQDPFDHFR